MGQGDPASLEVAGDATSKQHVHSLPVICQQLHRVLISDPRNSRKNSKLKMIYVKKLFSL